MGACYAVALVVTSPDPVAIQRWILTVGISVVTGLLVASMKERILRLVERLSGAARTDALTGILNRRAFEERFEEELARASRENRPLTVAVGDLDGFKLVNDRLGHQAGDEALRRVARELDKWKRRSDVTARIGGEEFALLLPGVDEQGAVTLADRVRLGIQEVFAADSVPLTISFGIAVFPEHGVGAAALMRASDQALYAAKEMGRNRGIVFTSELAESLDGSRAQVADSAEMQLETVIGLAEALDIRDTGTAQHSRTVARYAEMMAARDGPRRRARRAHRPRRPAPRPGQDRHLRPRAHQARPARRRASGPRCAPIRRSAPGCCRAPSWPIYARGSSPITSAPTAPATRSASAATTSRWRPGSSPRRMPTRP